MKNKKNQLPGKGRILEEMNAMEIVMRKEQQKPNHEKKIAQAILDAKQIYESNYKWGNGERIGYYEKSFEECCKIACENNDLPSNLAYTLSFACCNNSDVQKWAKDVMLKMIQLKNENIGIIN